MTTRERAPDTGSTVPLILGFFLIVLIMVAGSVAAGDAFVQQNQLQDLCDGAAVAAASTADADSGRHTGGATFLVLGAVQVAVEQYRDRDPARLDVAMAAALSDDRESVTVGCSQTRTIAFGSWFGFGAGVTHRVTSSARGRLSS
jgi:Flp pilus assembly protein TadG